MHLSFSPVRVNDTLHLARCGDALIINGETFDFAPLGEGASLPADAIDSPWFCGAVTREDGRLHLVLVLPYAPPVCDAVLFPQDIIDPPDGPVALPGSPEAKEI